MPSDLLQRRLLFTRLLPRLIDRAIALSYGCTINEVLRDPKVAQWNAAQGMGISNSLHLVGLAVDLNLFMPDGTYIKNEVGHTALGAYWKALDPRCAWGGDFTKRDWNHYAITYEGRR